MRCRVRDCATAIESVYGMRRPIPVTRRLLLSNFRSDLDLRRTLSTRPLTYPGRAIRISNTPCGKHPERAVIRRWIPHPVVLTEMMESTFNLTSNSLLTNTPSYAYLPGEDSDPRCCVSYKICQVSQVAKSMINGSVIVICSGVPAGRLCTALSEPYGNRIAWQIHIIGEDYKSWSIKFMTLTIYRAMGCHLRPRRLAFCLLRDSLMILDHLMRVLLRSHLSKPRSVDRLAW